MTAAVTDTEIREPEIHPHEPLYFRSGDHWLFGWLSEPKNIEVSNTGLVICSPFGYESICAHRSIRALAVAAATVGVPALRFDYAGMGDSEDRSSSEEQLTIWKQNVLAAVAELQARTGVGRVCLLGIRLGALLATLAAAECEAVEALVVIAPTISGRRYVRELRTVQLAASQFDVVAPPAGPASGEGSVADTGSFEVSGFSLPRATIDALTEIDLSTLGSAPVPEMLVIDRNDLPTARAWTDTVSNLGARIEYRSLPGIVEMIWTTPHFGSVPQPIILAVSDWLTRQAAVARSASVGSHVRTRGSAAAVLRLPFDRASPRAVLTERPVNIDSSMFGVVTEPSSGEARRRGVVLLNAGATYHIGPNRLYVSLARQWAGQGYVVLRLDLAGLGDSATRPGCVENEVFPANAVDNVRAAVQFLRDHYKVRDITVGGLCSGGYHALRAAIAAVPMNRALVINIQNFFWKEGMTLSDLQLAEVVKNPGVYRERVLSMASWKRLLTGRVNIWRIAMIYLRRTELAIKTTFRDLARRLHIRLPNDLGRELEEVAARGTRIVFAFSRDDAGVSLLRLQAGSSLDRLGDRCRIHVIEGADHIFSQNGSRRVLESLLSEELFARSPEVSPRLPVQAVASSSR